MGRFTVTAAMLSEANDYREIEVELGSRHWWKPRFMGISIGWKDPSPEQMIAEAHEDAERIANSTNYPPGRGGSLTLWPPMICF